MKSHNTILITYLALSSTGLNAAECVVNDADIASTYSGQCGNGFAEGKGIATGRDKYGGEFQNGMKHGRGIYEWADGVRYEGKYKNDKREGFGKMMIPRAAYTSQQASGKGEWKGDFYIQQGLFVNGTHVLQCASEVDCGNKQRLESEKQAREERERIARACDRFYSGKAIGFKPAGIVYFGSVLDAVVLGKGDGNVSIKITDTHFDSYGKTLEVPCRSDQLK